MFEKKKTNTIPILFHRKKKEYLTRLFCKGTELRSVSAVIGALKRGCNNDTLVITTAARIRLKVKTKLMALLL